MKNQEHYIENKEVKNAIIKVNDKVYKHNKMDCIIRDLIAINLEIEHIEREISSDTDLYKVIERKMEFIVKYTDIDMELLRSFNTKDVNFIYELVKLGFKVDKYEKLYEPEDINKPYTFKFKDKEVKVLSSNLTINALEAELKEYRQILYTERKADYLLGCIKYIVDKTDLEEEYLLELREHELEDLMKDVYGILISTDYFELTEKKY